MIESILIAALLNVNLDTGWSGSVTPEKGAPYAVENIQLPHSWDDYYGHRHLFHGELHGKSVYKRSFTAAKKAGERQFLVFEGAGTYLTVKVNGQTLLENEHAGRVATTVEITEAMKDGENLLEVGCDHPSNIINTPWQCGGCGNNTCESPEPFGLFRKVRLETTGAVRIAPYGAYFWHDGGCNTGYAEVELDAGKAATDGLVVRVTQPELGVDLKLKPGERGEFPVAKAKRWSPEAPALYSFKVEVLDKNGAVLDSESVRTGYVTMKWPFDGAADHRFFLNGKPLFVHGTAQSDHRLGSSHAFDREENFARIRELKRMGFNCFRDGHEPHDREVSEAMEELGIMHFAGFSTHIYTDTKEFQRQFLKSLEQWVKEKRNSPTVVIWSLQNESALPAEFSEECCALIRKLDPMSSASFRPIVTCNGGAGVDRDVIQNWSGTYEGYGGRLATYDIDLARPNQLLNGEYGAWRLMGWHTDPEAPFDIKGPWSEEHQARVLWEKLIRGWKAHDKVCGHVLWTFFSHRNPGRSAKIEEAYRTIDKAGPVNYKGLYTLSGQRVAAWYVYHAFGYHFQQGDLDQHLDETLTWWIAEGHRLVTPPAASPVKPTPIVGKAYVFRLNCGGDRYVDANGDVWQADDSRYVKSWSQYPEYAVDKYNLCPVLASQGVIREGVLNVSAADQALFGTYRYGRDKFMITLPAPANADCTVEMYFVEPGSYGRSFDLALNGKVVETRFNPSGNVGERNAVVRRYAVKASEKGEIVVTFPRVRCNQAIVSAIAVATDAESAKKMVKDSRKPGYPESDGLTWAELDGYVRHSTPQHLLPPEKPAEARTRPPHAKPFADKDGYRRCLTHPYVAGDYSVTFKVVKGNPIGKTVKWKIEGEDWCGDKGDMTIKTGETVLTGPIDENGIISMPLDTYINAGGFFFLYKIDDDSLSAREFIPVK